MAGLWICGFVGMQWNGLLWFGLVFYYIHTSLYLTCLHGLNAINEVVMCFLFPFKTPSLNQVDRQKEQWESKKSLKTPVLACRVAVVVFHVSLSKHSL